MSDTFHLHSGPTVGTVGELRDALAAGTQEQVAHHVAKGRNDFAAWAAGSLQDEELAQSLRPCTTRDEVVQVLDAWLAKRTQTRLDDDAFNVLKEEMNGRNESVGERFEELGKRFETALKDPYPEELAKIDERLVNRYEELRGKISELRRQGKDMFISALMLRPFAAKIALARATRDKGDFEKVKVLLDQVAFEVEEARNAKVVNVKEEVNALAGIEKKKE